jgi:hypothetical protein
MWTKLRALFRQLFILPTLDFTDPARNVECSLSADVHSTVGVRSTQALTFKNVSNHWLELKLASSYIQAQWKYELHLSASFLGRGDNCGHCWPIVPTPDDRRWWLWSNWWNEDWQGKPRYSEKTCPTATLSTTNPIWLDPVRSGVKPTTNSLNDAAVLSVSYY